MKIQTNPLSYGGTRFNKILPCNEEKNLNPYLLNCTFIMSCMDLSNIENKLSALIKSETFNYSVVQ